MVIAFNILLSPFLYNNTMYTMAALVSTASALHFMVKVTLTFIFWLSMEGLIRNTPQKALLLLV